MRPQPSPSPGRAHLYPSRRITTGPNAREVIRKCYDFALSHASQDKDSYDIWQDYINFLKAGEVCASHWRSLHGFPLSLWVTPSTAMLCARFIGCGYRTDGSSCETTAVSLRTIRSASERQANALMQRRSIRLSIDAKPYSWARFRRYPFVLSCRPLYINTPILPHRVPRKTPCETTPPRRSLHSYGADTVG